LTRVAFEMRAEEDTNDNGTVSLTNPWFLNIS
jgi:hypothetical protein